MATLVTGGGGFVGLNIVEELIAHDQRVVIFDRHECLLVSWANVASTSIIRQSADWSDCFRELTPHSEGDET